MYRCVDAAAIMLVHTTMPLPAPSGAAGGAAAGAAAIPGSIQPTRRLDPGRPLIATVSGWPEATWSGAIFLIAAQCPVSGGRAKPG
jgi:hypothetical protein